MAGEYSVAAELNKRGFNASITLGNAKAADIIITKDLGDVKIFKSIEVKTSRESRIVTSFFPKYSDKSKSHPDYWVIVHIDDSERFHYYILTHEELGHIQMVRNNMDTWAPIPKGTKRGCDNILLSSISQFENKWDKITI